MMNVVNTRTNICYTYGCHTRTNHIYIYKEKRKKKKIAATHAFQIME